MAKKMKTHKGTAKRFKITNAKKIVHDKAAKNHLLTNKGSTKNTMKSGKLVHKSDVKRVFSLAPYGIN
ncbi:MAG TPA: 50S ribosomal protein L35 [Candidatus Absconditabacterales bacterium]|nr:50S ribosomal protein L35 [Candidatus Absconditabacterales bacterium]